MTERKWTPGPWRKTTNSGEITDKDGMYIGRAIGVVTTEGNANAHLISAAPDLAVIADLVASLPIQDDIADDVPVMGLDGFYITHGDVRAARAARAKAEGRET